MPITVLDAASLSAFTLILACGQVLFKRVGLSLQGHTGLEALLTVLREPSLYVALATYGIATLLWIWILSRVTLIQAYPWVSLGTVIVPLLGWVMFGERVAPVFWLGVVLIVAGIGLTQYAAARPRLSGAPPAAAAAIADDAYAAPAAAAFTTRTGR